MQIRSIAGGVEVLAPAKLNLFLEVLGRRPDGYHELETVMVAIDLYDTLTIRDAPSGVVRLRCDDPALPVDADNLVVRAAERLRLAAGASRGAEIELTKAIPVRAGLGGGSSDAAATLAGLNHVWGLAFSTEHLDALAADVGSDVPFFNHTPAAICRGRGERVEAVPLRGRHHFVLICPSIGMSTAKVFQNVVVPEKPRSPGPVLEALSGRGTAPLGEALFNRLQPVAEALEPELVRARNSLTQLGPLLDGLAMTGSGSAYFGPCPNLAAAHQAAEALKSLGLGWVRVVTCGP